MQLESTLFLYSQLWRFIIRRLQKLLKANTNHVFELEHSTFWYELHDAFLRKTYFKRLY